MFNIKRLGKTLIFALICIFLVSCEAVTTTDCTCGNANINVNVNNEVTNKVVEYEEITITDFQNTISETVKSVESACVGIRTKELTEVEINGKKFPSEDDISIGSGVIYKREQLPNNSGFKYYVITNHHVIENEDTTGKAMLTYYVYYGYEDVDIKATLIGYDEKVDLALLTFEHTTYIDPVEFADSDDIERGDIVIAIGNPRGLEYFNSTTFGVVSGPVRYYNEDLDEDGINDFLGVYIQHDAAINSGNSGGGLFTIDGKLLGINRLKLLSVNGIDTDNMGFAIPSNVVQTVIIDHIEKNIEIVRPRLGITTIEVRDLTPAVIFANNLKTIPTEIYLGEKPYGLYVTEDVLPGYSLSNTGIGKDDIILEFNGEKITAFNVIAAKLNSLVDYTIGEEITIKYYDRSTNSIATTTAILKAAEK